MVAPMVGLKKRYGIRQLSILSLKFSAVTADAKDYVNEFMEMNDFFRKLLAAANL